MLTTDTSIGTGEYWDKLYRGEKSHLPVVDDIQIERKPVFDRLGATLDLITPLEADGTILDIGSGKASLCKRIRDKYPSSYVIASDVSEVAKELAGYRPYSIIDSYATPFSDKRFDLIICTSVFECMEFPNKFLAEAKRIGKKLIISAPNGEMANWSQLRIYNEESFRAQLEEYGTIESLQAWGHMFLAKVIL